MVNSYKYQLNNIEKLILISFIFLIPVSCKKFLDVKPVQSQVVPTSLYDLQTLLDNSLLNTQSASGLSEIVSDNYYLTTANWQSRSTSPSTTGQSEAFHYIWDGSIPYVNSWYFPYQYPIYYANVVLDQLSLINIKPEEYEKYNSVKGAALFYRAFAFLGLSQLYCKPYSEANGNDPGIILKLTSNVSAKSSRSTVSETYHKIIADLKESADLMSSVIQYPSRPSKTAAYAALARTYLCMRDYVNAKIYANLALQQNNTLIDYNTLVPIGVPPIKTFNSEVIFNSATSSTITGSGFAKIDSLLYRSYNDNDLRKTVFFKANTGANIGTYYFQGSYHGNYNPNGIFDGLATDELYLIRAESHARTGNKDAAMSDLNSLMVKRWKNNGTWELIAASNAVEALDKILIERRKELVYRGLRWSDIRRFNLDGANITLKRFINNIEYKLPPNDLRTVMIIPFEEISRSGIFQNPR